MTRVEQLLLVDFDGQPVTEPDGRPSTDPDGVVTAAVDDPRHRKRVGPLTDLLHDPATGTWSPASRRSRAGPWRKRPTATTSTAVPGPEGPATPATWSLGGAGAGVICVGAEVKPPWSLVTIGGKTGPSLQRSSCQPADWAVGHP